MAAKGWTMTAVAIAVVVGTYFTLETMYPPSKNGDVDLRLVSPETVFEAELREDASVAEATVDDASQAGVAELAPAGTPDVLDLTEDSADGGDHPAASGDQPAATTEREAEDTATDEPADGDAAGTADQMQAADPAPAPTATPEPTATPSPKTAPTLAPGPRPTPKVAPPPAPASAPPTARLTQWWGPESEGRLSVVYAGSAAYTRAIVLMFNGAFHDAASAQQHLRVRDASGKTVDGSWDVGTSNRRMLLFPVSRTGTYTVTVGAGLADQNGRAIGKELQGPVRVQ